MEQQPTGIWDALWPLIGAAVDAVTQVITVDLMITLLAIAGAMVFTLFATHYAKIAAEHLFPKVTETATGWRLFCMAAAVIIGAIAGTAVWLIEGLPWWIIPMVAILPGVTWRLLREKLSAERRRALMTPTDRKHRRKV